MKRFAMCILFLLILCLIYVSCGSKQCHYCGKEITGEALKKDGRYYCDVDCYMNEFMGIEIKSYINHIN